MVYINIDTWTSFFILDRFDVKKTFKNKRENERNVCILAIRWYWRFSSFVFDVGYNWKFLFFSFFLSRIISDDYFLCKVTGIFWDVWLENNTLHWLEINQLHVESLVWKKNSKKVKPIQSRMEVFSSFNLPIWVNSAVQRSTKWLYW